MTDKLIPVSSPDGTFSGWIAPSLIVSVDASGHYCKYLSNGELRDGTLPYQLQGRIADRLGLKQL